MRASLTAYGIVCGDGFRYPRFVNRLIVVGSIEAVKAIAKLCGHTKRDRWGTRECVYEITRGVVEGCEHETQAEKLARMMAVRGDTDRMDEIHELDAEMRANIRRGEGHYA